MTFLRKSLVILIGIVILQSYFVVVSMEELTTGHSMQVFFKLGNTRYYETRQGEEVKYIQRYEEETILNLTNHTGAEITLFLEFVIHEEGENKEKATVYLHNNTLLINDNIQLSGQDLVRIFNQAMPIKYNNQTNVKFPVEFNDVKVISYINSTEASMLIEKLIAQGTGSDQFKRISNNLCYRCDRFLNLPEEEDHKIVTIYNQRDILGFNLVSID